MVFLRENSTPTISHCCRKPPVTRSTANFHAGPYSRRMESGRNGSNVYKVKQLGGADLAGEARLGDLSVSETEGRRMAVMQRGARRCHATQTKGRHNTILSPNAAAAQ